MDIILGGLMFRSAALSNFPTAFSSMVCNIAHSSFSLAEIRLGYTQKDHDHVYVVNLFVLGF